jgi:hypothetical protein
MTRFLVVHDSTWRGVCRGCGAAIVWADLASGARHPFDAAPVTHVQQPDLFSGRVIDEVEAISHYATCPHAEAFR